MKFFFTICRYQYLRFYPSIFCKMTPEILCRQLALHNLPEHDIVGKFCVTFARIHLTFIIWCVTLKFSCHWVKKNTICLFGWITSTIGIHRNALAASVPILTFSINIINRCTFTVFYERTKIKFIFFSENMDNFMLIGDIFIPILCQESSFFGI